MALALQRVNDCRLLSGRHLSKYGRTLGQICQGCRCQAIHLRTKDDMIDWQANIVADLPGDNVIVSSQDLYLYAALFEGSNGCGGRLLRRIEKRNETK